MTRPTTRRRCLAVVSSGSIAAIAGCSGLVDDIDSDDEDPVGDEQGHEGEEEPVEDVDHESPDGEVSFVTPEDGAEVTAPVEVEIEVENFEVQPADDEEDANGTPDDGAGHMHVIVDHGCVDPGYPIPFEDGYNHLGDGELETELDLDPGEYDLCLQAADDTHNAYDLTDDITIEVVEEDGGDGTEGETEDAENESDE